MVGRDPDHEYFSSLFPFENEQQPEKRRTAGTIYEIILGLIRESTRFGMVTMNVTKKTFPSMLMNLLKENDDISSSRSLPEDVVLEILRRLSPEHILICRMVCKRWISLTSTPHFHLTPAPPVLLLQQNAPDNDTKLYYLDLIPDKPRIVRFDTTKLHPKRRRHFYGGTCNGLVLLWGRETFGTLLVSSYNPLTGREITLSPVEADFYLGFWFHPTKRDYFFLTRSDAGGGGLGQSGYLYKIFNFRGECTVLGWYAAVPSHSVPVNINGSLYFLLNTVLPLGNPRYCIMIFNIESEEIDFKAHPHYDHCYVGHGAILGVNADMSLLDVEGSLGFAHLCSIEHSLCLWVLEECATWKWIPRHKININWDSSMTGVCALSGTQKGEMVMHYRYRRLFAVNLETRRIRKIDISFDVASRLLTACTYVTSLVDPSSMAVRT